MPDRNSQCGVYGAHAIKGHEAVARQFDALAGFIATPITARRGLLTRRHYPTRSDRARAATRTAGLTATPRTIRAWLEGARSPSRASLAAISARTARCGGRTSPATSWSGSTGKAAAPGWSSTR
jgi:hypothetical protein